MTHNRIKLDVGPFFSLLLSDVASAAEWEGEGEGGEDKMESHNCHMTYHVTRLTRLVLPPVCPWDRAGLVAEVGMPEREVMERRI